VSPPRTHHDLNSPRLHFVFPSPLVSVISLLGKSTTSFLPPPSCVPFLLIVFRSAEASLFPFPLTVVPFHHFSSQPTLFEVVVSLTFCPCLLFSESPYFLKLEKTTSLSNPFFLDLGLSVFSLEVIPSFSLPTFPLIRALSQISLLQFESCGAALPSASFFFCFFFFFFLFVSTPLPVVCRDAPLRPPLSLRGKPFIAGYCLCSGSHRLP